MPNVKKQWDTIIKNALVFDGTGEKPLIQDIAIKDGRFAAKGLGLEPSLAKDVVDGTGKWLMPGLVEIHTHYDLEVEVAPDLPESVRHGTTTVVMSNCSLGTAFGNQREGLQDPIVDCFARVENIPKDVLHKVADQIDWDNTGDYLKHLDELPLGPNVAPMVPHSMLRIEVMGIEDSISRDPTAAEEEKMVELLQKAVDEGYVGFSTDLLPTHYLANDPHRNATIPTQHAKMKEVKKLTKVLRDNDRVWQTTPDPENRLLSIKNFLLTSGRFYGKPLKTTATAAMDLDTNKGAAKGLVKFNKLLNSKFINGHFRFQALPAPFITWADGVTTPLLEEMKATRLLNAYELDDKEGRMKLMHDPAFVEQFRKDWMRGKKGFNFARLERKLEIEPETFSKDLDRMFIETCPFEQWNGEKMGDIYNRLLAHQTSNHTSGSKSPEEKEMFDSFPSPIVDDANFMLHLLRQFDRELRWHTTTANKNPEVLKKLLFHEETLPGFTDSGAHLVNMAFFDGNLRTLKIAAHDSIELVSQAVKRLTKEPAELFAMDAGTLELGAQADITLIDPDALKTWNPDANRITVYRDIFEHEQMVNRSDDVVPMVMIAGKVAWENNKFKSAFGKEKYGRVMTYCKPEDRLSQQYQNPPTADTKVDKTAKETATA